MSAMARGQRHFLIVLVAGSILAATAAWACPICFSGRVAPLGQKIDAADAVVLADPFGEAGPYRVTATVKGAVSTGTLIVDAISPPPAFVVQNRPMLLVRNRSSQQWSGLGSVGKGQADWLRALAAGGPDPTRPAAGPWPRTVDATADSTDADWIARLALIAPALESPDRLVAEIAYGELARTPYRLMRNLKGAREPAEVAEWLGDPELIARKPAYTLLLGIVGQSANADQIEAEIDRLRTVHDATNLAALIAADLEIRGPDRLPHIVAAYLTDKARDLPEIEAALLALSVQGTADARIPRAQIVSAYRSFITTHPAMASFVVQDLSDWNAYGIADAIEVAMKTGAIRDPAAKYQVLTYLQRGTGHPATQQGIGGDLPP